MKHHLTTPYSAAILRYYPMLGPVRETEKHSSSAANLAIAQQWLGDRLTNHERKAHSYCESLEHTPLPTRLIDVGASATGIRDPFLVETNGAVGTYLALSYCWGEPSI